MSAVDICRFACRKRRHGDVKASSRVFLCVASKTRLKCTESSEQRRDLSALQRFRAEAMEGLHLAKSCRVGADDSEGLEATCLRGGDRSSNCPLPGLIFSDKHSQDGDLGHLGAGL